MVDVAADSGVGSTAGLEDLPAIESVDISKNAIREVPNPRGVAMVVSRCARVAGKDRTIPFNDKDNPIHEIKQREARQRYAPVYLYYYFKQHVLAMEADLRRRIGAGEAISMAYFKNALRLDDALYPVTPDDAVASTPAASDYREMFYIARLAGFDVNEEASRVNDDGLVMRSTSVSDVDAFVAGLKRRFC